MGRVIFYEIESSLVYIGLGHVRRYFFPKAIFLKSQVAVNQLFCV